MKRLAPALVILFSGLCCNNRAIPPGGGKESLCLVQPDTLEFSTVVIGDSTDLSFLLINAGTDTLEDTLEENCPDYELVVGSGSFRLAPGETLLAVVRFKPASEGEQACSIEPVASRCPSVFCSGSGEVQVAYFRPAIVRRFYHYPQSFTQGLLLHQGFLYESAGLYSNSKLFKARASDGVIVKLQHLPSQYFAEGLALLDTTLVQLTWLEHVAFIWGLSGLATLGTFAYAGEGWGLTTVDSLFVMSNGTDTLYFRDKDFQVVRKLRVSRGGVPLANLNELEYAEGLIYANVYRNDSIYGIEPASGLVRRIVSCDTLVKLINPIDPGHVLNGIAYDPGAGTFYLTGKMWPEMFEVRFVRIP